MRRVIPRGARSEKVCYKVILNNVSHNSITFTHCINWLSKVKKAYYTIESRTLHVRYYVFNIFYIITEQFALNHIAKPLAYIILLRSTHLVICSLLLSVKIYYLIL